MQASDLDSAAELYLRAYRADWSRDKAKAYLAKFHTFEPEHCYVADDGGKCAGAILGFTFEKETGLILFIQELFVDPDRREKGLGRQLVQKLRDTATPGSVRIKPLVKADTGVLNFYNSLGFEKDKAVSFSFED